MAAHGYAPRRLLHHVEVAARVTLLEAQQRRAIDVGELGETALRQTLAFAGSS
jgi:hypothetical protein